MEKFAKSKSVVALKKRSPRKGTKTSLEVFHKGSSLEKKVPEKGDENNNGILHSVPDSQIEKKVPEKGDENLFPVTLVTNNFWN